MFLIENEFALVPFRFGFVEASFASLGDAFEQWLKEIDAKFAVKTEFRNIVAPLERCTNWIRAATPQSLRPSRSAVWQYPRASGVIIGSDGRLYGSTNSGGAMAPGSCIKWRNVAWRCNHD
jgi:hypothetical protein